MFTNRPAMNRDYTPSTEEAALTPDGLEGVQDNLYFMRDAVQRRLLAEFDCEVNQENQPQLRQMIESPNVRGRGGLAAAT